MKLKPRLLLLLALLAIIFSTCQNQTRKSIPEGFVYLTEIIPGIQLEMRYFGGDNFVGKPIDGYKKEVCIISEKAALALKEVQDELSKDSLSLLIFDAYRPQTAVNHFVRWAENLSDTLTKQKYYPNVNKEDLFRLNYIAEKSSHSRGSTVDLTILSKNGVKWDMGTCFDYFGPLSWPGSDLVSTEQKENRLFLQNVMMKYGFKPYQEEWWHFTLSNESFPDTYFDFPIQ